MATGTSKRKLAEIRSKNPDAYVFDLVSGWKPEELANAFNSGKQILAFDSENPNATPADYTGNLRTIQRQLGGKPLTGSEISNNWGQFITSLGSELMSDFGPLLSNAALAYGAGGLLNAAAGAPVSSAFSMPAAQIAATIPAQSAVSALTAAGVPASTISSIAATQGVAGLNAAAASLGTTTAGATGGLLSASFSPSSAGTTGAGASAADLEAAMQIPAGTSATVGGQALTSGQIAALNAGGSIAEGQVLNAAGQVVGALPGAGGGGLFGTGITGTQALSTGLGLLGSYAGGQAATGAAQTSANAQIEAARIAAEASRFRPVGVTTRFGQSQFGYDPQGNLVSAGYQLSPELKAQQDALMAMSGQALTQYQGAPAATAPMAQGAQTLFGLGQGYLATTPQEQAAKFMAEQQALLAPSRERELAALNARLQAQGRGGLAIGGTSTGMMAANPELEAYYNALRQQDLALAAQATQGGQQYATFGAGLLGTGGDLQRSMYGTQQAAYAPYQTALGGATTLEQLGQTPLDIGTSLGSATTAAAAAGGRAMQQGMTGAAQTMQPANAYSPWGSLLTGAGQAIGQYGQPQQPTYDPNKFRLVPFGS